MGNKYNEKEGEFLMGTDVYMKKTVDSSVLKNELITTAGLWIDGKAFWLKTGTEKLLIDESMSIQLKKENIHSKIHFFEIYLTNHSSVDRRALLLFMHQHQEATRDHFSFISPSENVIYHLANNRVYLVNGQINGNAEGQRTVQPYWNFYNDLIWSNLEKGVLKYNPMTKGAAVSIFSLETIIPPNKTIKGSSWVIMDDKKLKLERLNKAFLKKRTSISN
ncbi:hypothetical protein [Bacillus massilinigeriensis]|uniref:hypothetical protein n=1 Tax=Bacillus massilionigeriensis TaxID=1805475 RepID=UPI00114D448D|nr:hypothetical protein [Bacillus massilionigeriensis]